MHDEDHADHLRDEQRADVAIFASRGEGDQRLAERRDRGQHREADRPEHPLDAPRQHAKIAIAPARPQSRHVGIHHRLRLRPDLLRELCEALGDMIEARGARPGERADEQRVGLLRQRAHRHRQVGRRGEGQKAGEIAHQMARRGAERVGNPLHFQRGEAESEKDHRAEDLRRGPCDQEAFDTERFPPAEQGERDPQQLRDELAVGDGAELPREAERRGRHAGDVEQGAEAGDRDERQIDRVDPDQRPDERDERERSAGGDDRGADVEQQPIEVEPRKLVGIAVGFAVGGEFDQRLPRFEARDALDQADEGQDHHEDAEFFDRQRARGDRGADQHQHAAHRIAR